MKKLSLWLAVLAVAISVTGCTKRAQQQPAPVMKLPVTTASEGSARVVYVRHVRHGHGT